MRDLTLVTMDSHGQSKYSLLDESSHKGLEDLLARAYQVEFFTLSEVRLCSPVER